MAPFYIRIHPLNWPPFRFASPFSINETFSGAGGNTAAGGATGFDEPGWTDLGDGVGTFLTNGFSEQVYSLAIDDQSGSGLRAGVVRTLGIGGFVAELELSNVGGSAPFAGAGLVVSDSPGVEDNAVAVFVQNQSGDTVINFFENANSTLPGGVGSANLGAGVDRVTLRLTFTPKGNNGIFAAFAQANESGPFVSVGSTDFDGVTPINPNRTVATVVSAFSVEASAEFDRLTIIPEPATLALAFCGGLMLVRRRRL
ncbi:MAG: hypothetical protein QF749_13465 [Verrucomicrobiota bacterium]|nr:hypothetical protein [Verrucomicrobiota bacterium]